MTIEQQHLKLSYNLDNQMYLSKRYLWHSKNCLHYLKNITQSVV